VTYEAEAPDNRLTGGASIGSCPKCSGGKKVGNVGGGSNLILESITVPKAGTYLMTMSMWTVTRAGKPRSASTA